MPSPRPLPLLLLLALVLQPLGLATAPLAGLATPAWADDDDDDDGHRGKGHRHKHHKHGHGEHDDDDDDNGRGGRGQAAPPATAAPPELLVLVTVSGDAARLEAAGFAILGRERLGLLEGELLRLGAPAGMATEEARRAVARLAPGATQDLNSLYRPEEFGCGSEGCAAFQAVGWSVAAVCPLAPLIGMLDTPVNAEHPGLAGQALERQAVLAPGRTPASAVHGTAIAALLIGAPGGRTPGLLPNARLLAAEVFHRDAAGVAQADAFDLLRGLQLMADRGVTVVNLSFAGPANALLELGLVRLAARGVALVAAAGNGGPEAAPLYPGAYPGVIAVTAVDRNFELFSQAARGPHIAFAAPGVKLWTAASVSGGRFRSGTSYAAPFVTAALAAQRAATPGLPPSLLVELLAAHARDLGAPGRDVLYGWGLVQSPPCPTGRG